MAKKITKKELAERKARYAENRRLRLAEKKAEALKAARKAARIERKKTKFLAPKATLKVGAKRKPKSPPKLRSALLSQEEMSALTETVLCKTTNLGGSYERQRAQYAAIEVAARDPMKGFVVFDIDGCVADDAWRHHLVVERKFQSKDVMFHHYHSASVHDKALEHGADLVKACISAGLFIVFITARPEAYRQITREWFDRHFDSSLGQGACLLMRSDNDERSSVDIKHELIANAVEATGSSDRFVTAYDDREDVVRMYANDFGIQSFLLDRNGLTDVLGVLDKHSECLNRNKGKPDDSEVAFENAYSRDFENDPEPAADADATGTYRGGNAGAVFALSHVINQADIMNHKFGNCDVKVGDISAVLFPNGVKINSASDHRIMNTLGNLLQGIAMLVNSGMKDGGAATTLVANAGALASEISQASDTIEFTR